MKSITLRLVILCALWLSLGLTVVGLYVNRVATRQLQDAADARIAALHDAVTANVEFDAGGRLQLPHSLPTPEFEQPLSGVYWQITASGNLLRSKSLWDETLPPPRAGNGGAQWSTIKGPRNQNVRLLARAITLPDFPQTVWVQVAITQDNTEREIASLRRTLLLGLTALGALLVAGVCAIVIAGLRPLRQAKHALHAIRRGQNDRLALSAPDEIAPLFHEINALVAENHQTVERARCYVGNLAHALKTPLTVATNALASSAPDLALAQQQIALLNRTVAHHLARARISARSAAHSAQTGAYPLAIAQEVAAALRRIAPQVEIAVEGDASAQAAIDRQDLIELLGNLMDNAIKWAHSHCRVEIGLIRDAGPDARIGIRIEDDGPGMADEVASALARQRGERLDEAQAGSGLGLAIAEEIVLLYGGGMAVAPKGALGGVRVDVTLPAFG
ncbi:HAMP domain-containing sensor histidine kinase [Herminiimonas sp. CN]|uniref:sensor histidine kinase n=1 Tax=Herminiimonas sp. CN TaxID=1349818 RepID=UPI0004738FF9|nr:HAMP domain-containing sensor histidine kinase [Herminiimonas sp. CN]